eukprot:TRINITY_DN2126_c0_g1_i2.p3 TRINITY_DN2126_c0_g1~~TRINITY_DN2126_c0_g1_i2.p3  ORF type:complete len:52 (-),score=17.87 TRINITY_DN2126_c0_g1_i2:3-158(-)
MCNDAKTAMDAAVAAATTARAAEAENQAALKELEEQQLAGRSSETAKAHRG